MAIEMRHLGSEANQRKLADEFALVVKIMLATCGPNILNSDAKRALKITCKPTRAAVHPYFKSVMVSADTSVSLDNFISACYGTASGGLPWDPSHVEIVRSPSGSGLDALQAFVKLPMPNLKKLLLHNISHPTLLANGDWPKLEILELTFDKGFSDAISTGKTMTIERMRVPISPLTDLELTFNDRKCPGNNFLDLLREILAVFSHPKTLNLVIANVRGSLIIPSLAAASLPLLEELVINGSAANMLSHIAKAENWPSLRHLQLENIENRSFNHLDLNSSLWLKRLETLDIFGEDLFFKSSHC